MNGYQKVCKKRAVVAVVDAAVQSVRVSPLCTKKKGYARLTHSPIPPVTAQRGSLPRSSRVLFLFLFV